MTRAGELDRRIVIEHDIGQQDSHGQPIPNWIALDEVWAAVKPERGTEGVAAGQVQGQTPAVFKIRWRDDVTDRMRIKYDDRIWTIHGIAELGRRDALELSATTRDE